MARTVKNKAFRKLPEPIVNLIQIIRKLNFWTSWPGVDEYHCASHPDTLEEK